MFFYYKKKQYFNCVNYICMLKWILWILKKKKYFKYVGVSFLALVAVVLVGGYADQSVRFNNKWLSAFERWEYHEALNYFDQALEKKEFFEARSNKGLVLDALQQYEKALLAHDKALALAEDNEVVLNNKALTLTKMGRNDEAITYYTSSLALDGKSSLILYNRGVSYFELEMYEEALSDFDLALEYNTYNDEEYFYSTWYFKWIVLHMLKQFDEAIVAYDTFLEYDKSNQEILGLKLYANQASLWSGLFEEFPFVISGK